MLQDTMRKRIALPSKTWEGAEQPLSWPIPKAGLLATLEIVADLTVTDATTGGENALGLASAIENVRVATSLGYDLVNMSGPQYHHLMRHYINQYIDPVPHSNGRAEVNGTGAARLDMLFPFAINDRDELGLFPLQVTENQATLTLTKLADASVATNAVVTGTVTPYITVYSVPNDPEKWPAFRALHAMIAESRTVGGDGDFEYAWPTGNIYLRMLHGLGIAEETTPAGVDDFTRFRVMVGQSDTLAEETPNSLDNEFGRSHGYTRPKGLVAFDRMGSSGLGAYGTDRDWMNTAGVADIASRFVVANAPTVLHTVRDILIPVSRS